MKDIEEDIKELYIEFAQTAEIAQTMELEAGNLALTFATMSINPKTIDDEQKVFLRSLVDDVNKRTFGNLLIQIRKFVDIDEDGSKIINEALDKRNYLIHKFFRTHNFAIYSVEGRKAMRTDLENINKSLALARTALSGMTNALNDVIGRVNVTQEDIEALINAGEKIEI